MTEPFAGVPSWQQDEWNRHARLTLRWCPMCEVHLVPREGALCPCCSDTATYEATA